jgi:hypothetical protein
MQACGQIKHLDGAYVRVSIHPRASLASMRSLVLLLLCLTHVVLLLLPVSASAGSSSRIVVVLNLILSSPGGPLSGDLVVSSSAARCPPALLLAAASPRTSPLRGDLVLILRLPLPSSLSPPPCAREALSET